MSKTRSKDKTLESKSESFSDTELTPSPVNDEDVAKTIEPPIQAEYEAETLLKQDDSKPSTRNAEKPAPNVSLDVFGQVSGVKPDQFAGFKWYAKKQGMGPRPILVWRKEYQAFLTRGVA